MFADKDTIMASYVDGEEEDPYPEGYDYGSAPKYQQFEETPAWGHNGAGEERPKILLMGLI